MTNKITFKIFIGTTLTPDLRAALESNKQWKQDSTIKATNLEEILHLGKPYIGSYTSSNALSEIQKQERQIRDNLQEYCPKIDCNKLKIKIFAQEFLL